ncbi:hypothetical protein E1287_25740 [Actinomadura sp. KC06]|uniref:hypothetical protein n=1 Tax=Actinomadura sp. KC06 TaxID=2530369 RepID=UPI001046D6FE|nr:hypothetical protein [Actinomadura sp. KC06]TDD31666.1 hypothetical protein E1287_25740 [Actinomadura sp. KC06]
MTRCVSPNPYSPYANALPNARHLVPGFLGATPVPGVLAPTACDRMAVVPTEPLEDVTDLLIVGRATSLPPGLCTTCVGAAVGEEPPEDDPRIRPTTCRECGGASSQGEWCALCRQSLHDQWWSTRRGQT